MVMAHLHDNTLIHSDQDHYFDKISSSVKNYELRNSAGVHTLTVRVYETELWRTTTHAVLCPVTDKIKYSTQIAGPLMYFTVWLCI